MFFKEMNRDDLLKIINKLDMALYNHQIWFNSIIRMLLCKLPPDQHDLLLEAHKECRFGQWYYSEENKGLFEHPGFKALGDAHIHMHGLARNLLNGIHSGGEVTPFDYDQFANSVSRLQLEISSLKREVENILYNCDPTGAINRANMLTLLREQQEMCQQENEISFLVMVDFDHFNEIKDQHGQAVGDSLLTAAIHFILQNLPPFDKIFRYDGEVFVITLNNIEQKAAVEWVEAMRKRFSETDLLQVPARIRITASFSIAPLEALSTVEQSIEHAKKALLSAKSSGGNYVAVWNPTMM